MIAGTTMKVVQVVIKYLAYGWSPEEIHFQHPYFGMARVHSALATFGTTSRRWTRIFGGDSIWSMEFRDRSTSTR